MPEIPMDQVQEFIAADAKSNHLRLKERELLRAMHSGRTDVPALMTKSRARRQLRHRNIVWKTKLKQEAKNAQKPASSVPVQDAPSAAPVANQNSSVEAIV